MKAPDIFRYALKYLMDKFKVKRSEVADALKIHRPHMTSYLKGERGFSEDKREEIAVYFGMSYLEVLDLGRDLLSIERKPSKDKMNGEKSTKKSNVTFIDSVEDPIKKEHYKIIDEFPDPKEGLELNRLAVKCLKIDPGATEHILNFIRFQINEAKKKDKGNKDKASGES